jgi:hypothetical protein
MAITCFISLQCIFFLYYILRITSNSNLRYRAHVFWQEGARVSCILRCTLIMEAARYRETLNTRVCTASFLKSGIIKFVSAANYAGN